MGYILTSDVGTTAVKTVLADEDNNVILSYSSDIDTVFDNHFKEQNPQDWYMAICSAIKFFSTKGISTDKICACAFSGQMQDLILVDDKLEPVMNAVLYSDVRAANEAEEILSLLGQETVENITGNHFDGSMPFAKLLWVKKNRPEIYNRAFKLLISAKDYLTSRLTGICACDVISSSTSGMMDIIQKKWEQEWLKNCNLNVGLLPGLLYADEEVGKVSKIASEETGLPFGIPVYAGTGDAGASTLASGITSYGEYNINLGTTGWVAGISDKLQNVENVFNLAAIPRNLYINVVPFFNAGNVHKWISSVLTRDDEQKIKYEYISGLLESSVPGSHELLFLPYICGERFPISDPDIKGAYIGITPETTKQDMVRACLEGVAFSLKNGFNTGISSISLIGGGAQNPVWCQIFADVLNHEIIAFKNADILPSISVASIARVGMKAIKDYNEFVDFIKRSSECVKYYPNTDSVKKMNQNYERFIKIYPALKNVK